MSKVMKDMIVSEYKERFDGVENALLISIRGIGHEDTGTIRTSLRDDGIRVTVIRNSLARVAFKDTGLEAIEPLLTGPNAICYGAESVVDVARKIVDLLKKFPKLELTGAVLDGQVFKGTDGVKELSKYPTREEAIGQVVTLMLSPARKIAGAALGPGGKLVGQIKAIEEKLEKGETIAKVG
ncbi:MAG: 50S ribosomal protein L10 [Phycisphaeraceae bacterium]|nr:50S ribosomal protein L10 [Phycisphaerales bacterium]MCB9860778.1 50S ribosomal protein L10 [Phycisphaeraceae bacterium]